jgi:hypothetical protein
MRLPQYIKNAYLHAESFWKWERFLKTTASLSNLIPPCFYYLTNLVSGGIYGSTILTSCGDHAFSLTYKLRVGFFARAGWRYCGGISTFCYCTEPSTRNC